MLWWGKYSRGKQKPNDEWWNRNEQLWCDSWDHQLWDYPRTKAH